MSNQDLHCLHRYLIMSVEIKGLTIYKRLPNPYQTHIRKERNETAPGDICGNILLKSQIRLSLYDSINRFSTASLYDSISEFKHAILIELHNLRFTVDNNAWNMLSFRHTFYFISL